MFFFGVAGFATAGGGTVIRVIPEYHRFESVGRCIYCGSTDNLSDEHILAYALGGNWILPKASCARCACITGRDEALILRGGFWAVRNFLGFQSRTKERDQPTEFKLHAVNGDENKHILVAAEHYPVLLALPRFAGPLLLDLPDCTRQPGPPWHKFLKLDPEILLSTYGAEEYAPSSVNAHAFARMLMKTAHSLAVAEYGIDGFDPFLPKYILGEESTFLSFVGSATEMNVGDESDHILKVADFGEAPRRWIVGHINLFSRFGAPGYRIVVGQHKGYEPPNLALPQPPQNSLEYAAHIRMVLRFAEEEPPR